MPDGFVPVEPAGGSRSLPRPQHPRGEDAVEERLHQRGPEECRAALSLEADPERLLQRGAHGGEGRRVPGSLDPRKPVAGVGRQQPGQVPRLGERRAVRQRPAQVLAQPGADLLGEGARRFEPGLELLLCAGQSECLQPRGPARRVLSEQHEVAGVGDQHEPVPAPVAAHLIAGRGQPRVVVGRLDLHDAALRGLPLAQPAPLRLPGGVEAEVGMARALLGELADAVDPGLERAANGVQQVGQRRVVRALAGRAAGCADAAQVGKIALDGGGQILPCSCHAHTVTQQRQRHEGGRRRSGPRHSRRPFPCRPSFPPSADVRCYRRSRGDGNPSRLSPRRGFPPSRE